MWQLTIFEFSLQLKYLRFYLNPESLPFVNALHQRNTIFATWATLMFRKKIENLFFTRARNFKVDNYTSQQIWHSFVFVFVTLLINIFLTGNPILGYLHVFDSKISVLCWLCKSHLSGPNRVESLFFNIFPAKNAIYLR